MYSNRISFLSYRNRSFQTKTIIINKDFPLFYWKFNNTEDNFGDKLSYILVNSMVGGNISVLLQVVIQVYFVRKENS
jgi:hypothetical protein